MWQVRQQVVSRTEPELGLGIIIRVDSAKGIVETYFHESKETRLYAITTAPLQRFCLGRGDSFLSREGQELRVERIEERGGHFQYYADNTPYWEYDVEARPRDQGGVVSRLLSGQLDLPQAYELRQAAWELRGKAESSEVRGLVGARVKPLPHQLYIAAQVAKRPRPRVLLADEVGLGKTIEAGLIYAAMKALGRGERVLVLTPSSLTHQWLTEIYRRFGDMFSVLSEERCQEEEASQGLSPFLISQRIIVPMDLLLEQPHRLAQACAASWDLLIIDEAHHLDWDEEEPNPRWLAAKALSQVSNGLLLLTATPRQHGLATQFGLLQLVDPERYSDFDSFLAESEDIKASAQLAKQLAEGQWQPEIASQLARLFPADKELLRLSQQQVPESSQILAALVDRHGTGRVLFRNRRARLQGFPRRLLHPFPLSPSAAYLKALHTIDAAELSDIAVMDYATGRGLKRSFCDKPEDNPRYRWLLAFLEELGQEKALVICASQQRVLELEAFLNASWPRLRERKPRVAVFYEDLSILERDKQAALFADPQGAQVLLCSEIGGEGRNFQFTHRLILMDLPRLPDLLEQRIGRLDRIGQGKQVDIYVPWLEGTPEEALFLWYHRGLGSFEHSWNGADPLLEHFADELLYLFRAYFPRHEAFAQRAKLLELLLAKTQKRAAQLVAERQEGVDILLDLNSFSPTVGQKLLEKVEDTDDDPQLELFMRALLDYYGVDYDEFDERGSLLLKSDALAFIEHFPGLEEGQDTLLTFDRDLALVREDMLFLSQDHHLMESAIGLILDRNEGMASTGRWPSAPCGDGIIAQILVVLEATGPRSLELGRYLPLACKEFAVNHRSQPVSAQVLALASSALSPMPEDELPFERATLQRALKPILEQCLHEAQSWAEGLKQKALLRAKNQLEQEGARLRYLASINPNLSERDIAAFQTHYEAVLCQLEKAKPRLDALRVIFTFAAD